MGYRKRIDERTRLQYCEFWVNNKINYKLNESTNSTYKDYANFLFFLRNDFGTSYQQLSLSPTSFKNGTNRTLFHNSCYIVVVANHFTSKLPLVLKQINAISNVINKFPHLIIVFGKNITYADMKHEMSSPVVSYYFVLCIHVLMTIF